MHSMMLVKVLSDINQNLANSFVVCSSGYMAPEYALHGFFSIKSDVFSFGILLLEIISGMKSKGLPYPSQSYNLIGHVSNKNNLNFPITNWLITIGLNCCRHGSCGRMACQ